VLPFNLSEATGQTARQLISLWTKEEIMGAIIGWIIFGLIAGAIAKLLMPGRDPGGMVVTILLGIAGAVIGGFIGRAIWGSTGANDWSIGSFALAIAGAILLLFLYRLFLGRGSGTGTNIGRRAA
jgi:uncharacterized membrane protein YeaQ/YmgE (transglycosylase-associated protein family)